MGRKVYDWELTLYGDITLPENLKLSKNPTYVLAIWVRKILILESLYEVYCNALDPMSSCQNCIISMSFDSYQVRAYNTSYASSYKDTSIFCYPSIYYEKLYYGILSFVVDLKAFWTALCKGLLKPFGFEQFFNFRNLGSSLLMYETLGRYFPTIPKSNGCNVRMEVGTLYCMLSRGFAIKKYSGTSS